MYDQRLSVLASIGLAVGGILGMAGTFAPSAALRGLAWGIDGVALVMAGAILTVVFYRARTRLRGIGLSHLCDRRRHHLVGRRHGSRRKYPILRSREQPVGDGACPHQPSAGLSLPCTNTGTHRRESVCGDGTTDLRGRSALTHLVPIAFFRLSTLRRDLLRLDLDALEG